MARVGFEPATINLATADYTLGRVLDYAGALYRFVRFVDAVTYAPGQSVEWASMTLNTVTNDRAGGSSLGRIPAGIVVCTMTQNYYGFILVEGYYATCKTSGADDIVAGEYIFTHATTDGTVDGSTTWTVGCFGTATAADDNSADTVAANIMCL
jgi:hypothetical protein